MCITVYACMHAQFEFDRGLPEALEIPKDFFLKLLQQAVDIMFQASESFNPDEQQTFRATIFLSVL